jgi:hypothetical protein
MVSINKIRFHRNHFGHLLNFLGLTGSGVEVGVLFGHYSRELLRTWRGEKLYLVDPWRPVDDYTDTASRYDMEEVFHAMLENVTPYRERVSVCRSTSAEAVKNHVNSSLDYVYIDANHKYDHIIEDMNLWWPKVKNGGILCGHDFATIETDALVIQGERAVTDWAMKNNVSEVLVADCTSWFIRK